MLASYCTWEEVQGNAQEEDNAERQFKLMLYLISHYITAQYKTWNLLGQTRKTSGIQTHMGPVQTDTMHDKHTYLRTAQVGNENMARHFTWTNAKEQH